MSIATIILLFLAITIVVVAGLWCLILMTPPDRDEDGEEAERRFMEIANATGPVPLESRPRMRAGSWMGEVK